MSFLNPASFLLSLLMIIIVLMYLLRLRRTEQIVSSTFLWQRIVRDVEANAPWQKLQRNLLMLLQLLFLFTLILALANPYLWAEGTGSRSMIIIFDTSASMSAQDILPNRIEAAKQQALALIEAAPENNRVTVISASDKTEILISASQDRRQIQQTISSIQTTLGNSDLSSALQISAAITSRQPDTEILIFSDGNVDLPDQITINGSLVFYPIGLNDDNQGISDISLKQNTSGNYYTLFVQVKNFGPTPSSRRLEIYSDNTLIDAVDLTIDPYSQKAYIQENVPITGKIFEARLSNEDFFPLDDTAWVAGGVQDSVNVVLVTDGNRFIETALSILPNITFTSISPSAYEATEEFQADLVIFDGFIPSEDKYPRSNLLFIAPEFSTPFFDVVGIVDEPKPRPVSDDDPLLKNISVDGVNILQSTIITIPEWAYTSLIGDHDGKSIPLLVYGNRGGQRIAILSFKLQNSDLPIQVAFPLLIANLVNWLVPFPDSHTIYSSQSLAALSFSIPLNIDEVEVRAPDGITRRIIADQPGIISFEYPAPGVYSVRWDENNEFLVAANFQSTQESDITPIQQLMLTNGNSTSSQNIPLQSMRLVWRPLAIFALGILVLEWMLFHRGSLAEILSKITIREKR